jgi:hypothetical protein
MHPSRPRTRIAATEVQNEERKIIFSYETCRLGYEQALDGLMGHDECSSLVRIGAVLLGFSLDQVEWVVPVLGDIT